MPSPDDRPLIAVTLGDPAGVGPELVARVLARRDLAARCRPLVLGRPADARAGVEAAGVELEVATVERACEAAFRPGRIDVLALPAADDDVAPGVVSAAAGRVAHGALERAAALATDGEIDGIVSAPANKQALQLAGMAQTDELAYLADATGSGGAWLAGVMGRLWTTCVTLHVPLRAVPAKITRPSVLHAVRLLADALRASRASPRLAVAGLNPHAGDGGILGCEEVDEIAPAVAEARALGIDVVGPLPPDTVFPQARALGLDGVVCMYHDQANIARKLASFADGATLFLGLPVPAGTTAHGTAYDLAGLGRADAGSLARALEETLILARQREVNGAGR